MNALFGGTFSTHARRVAIWSRAATIPGCDRAVWRCDDQGRIIRWSDYGDGLSRYGWKIQRAPAAGLLASALGVAEGRAVHWDAEAVEHLRAA